MQAQSEWDRGRQSFRRCTFESVADNFWRNQVCSTVFNACERNYRYMSDMLEECKAGARQFTEQTIKRCVGGSNQGMESCRGMGETAATSVASTYCRTARGGNRSRNKLFPKFCVNNAVDTCRSNFFRELANCGYGTLRDKSKYRRQCEREVRRMVRGTELPDC